MHYHAGFRVAHASPGVSFRRYFVITVQGVRHNRILFLDRIYESSFCLLYASRQHPTYPLLSPSFYPCFDLGFA